MRSLCCLTLVVAVALPPCSSAWAQIGALTAGAVLDHLFNRAQALVDKGANTGDYLLGKAGITARIAIENARLASEDVLSKGVSEISKERRDALANIDSILSQIESGALSALEGAAKLEEGGQQIASILDIQGYRSYLTRYHPEVLFDSGVAANVLIKVRGVNLDDAGAELKFGENKFKPTTATKQEIVFEVPRSIFVFDRDRPLLFSGTLELQSVKPGWVNRMFGNREPVRRDIAFQLLPERLARYEYQATVDVVGQLRRHVDVWLPQFKGYDSDMDFYSHLDAGI